ncbi:MAG: tRNA epoxyqueuosine(34) reductase QueG [Verrucomicrobiota bacterium]
MVVSDQQLETRALKAKALDLGFDLCAIGPVAASPHADYLSEWLEQGRAADMEPWMGRNPEVRKNPAALLPEARSLVVLGMNYYQPEPELRGRIAKYALGKDYHDLIPERLEQLDDWLAAQGGVQRKAVDTSAILEKPAAVTAGLGWQGKSTILIHPKWGTWMFLAELLTTLDFQTDPEIKNHCGSCTRCIDACPTGAITGPYQLDSRRCISYLTIEHKGAIPIQYRRAIGDHLYGCDDCLDVCPWNRWAQKTREATFDPIPRVDLTDMLGWSDDTFRNEFRGTPIFRLKRPRWLRNICVVLGNIGGANDLPALKQAADDPDPLVSEHAKWAINEINGRISTA